MQATVFQKINTSERSWFESTARQLRLIVTRMLQRTQSYFFRMREGQSPLTMQIVLCAAPPTTSNVQTWQVVTRSFFHFWEPPNVEMKVTCLHHRTNIWVIRSAEYGLQRSHNILGIGRRSTPAYIPFPLRCSMPRTVFPWHHRLLHCAHRSRCASFVLIIADRTKTWPVRHIV